MPLTAGKHIVTGRCGYTHHGIYLGDNEVIHYSGFERFAKKGAVAATTLAAFADGCEVWPYVGQGILAAPSYEPWRVAWRARSRVGEDEYNLLWQNCEGFANWCTHNINRSSQVDDKVSAAAKHAALSTLRMAKSSVPVVIAGTLILALAAGCQGFFGPHASDEDQFKRGLDHPDAETEDKIRGTWI